MKKRTIIYTLILALLLFSMTGTLAVSAADAQAGASKASILDTDEMFTDRDLKQEPDLSKASTITVSDGEDVHITEEGVYVLSGKASDVTIYVESDKDAKVQLVLDALEITNTSAPCIYIVKADKAFITTVSDSSLSVKEGFTTDDDANGVIYSKSDLVMNGTGTLTINSSANGIVGKDDLKFTGATYIIQASSKAIAANDSIRIADGSFTLTAGTDALHAENKKDDSLGYIYVSGGEFDFTVGDDAIHATSVVQIDDGTFKITGAEGIEATYVQINGGSVYIEGKDDGINAANKSSAYTATFEMNDGELTIVMNSDHTDGIDSNGDLYINGGTIDITADKAFDCNGTALHNGGTILINGEPMD